MKTNDPLDLLYDLDESEIEKILFDWLIWARDDQLPPAGDWNRWLILGGRGAGKTRCGAEWVRALVLGLLPGSGPACGRIALVGETYSDVRDVMIEGLSGLLSVHPKSERPNWQSSRRRLEWPNGAIAQAFSSEDPESLRGPQFDAAWCDELCKWRYQQDTWDMLQFGLRIGENPRQVITTTPRPQKLLKEIMADQQTRVTRSSTLANVEQLSKRFIDTVFNKYGGTRLGRQELEGEIVEDRADALWNRLQLDQLRRGSAPELSRIIVAIDPPASSNKSSDACGIIAAGICDEGKGFILKDATLERAPPLQWAKRAVSLYAALSADCIVAEVNQGGEMVETIIREADPSVPVKSVRATRGKYVRAEPVSAFYDQGRVHHVGAFPELEDEMCDFGLDGLTNGRSPDRLDALVWALTELMMNRTVSPRIRFF